MHKNSLFRVNTGGNFCGHYPESPVLYPLRPAKKGKGGIPGVLTALYERLEQFYFRPTAIPSLNFANGSFRQMRTERRDACVCLSRAIVEATDLASLRVGLPTADGFVNYTLSYLIARSGLSLYRGRRAFRDLCRAGLISAAQARRLNEQGEYRGLPAVKAVSAKLFAIFGLGERLKQERKKATRRLRKKAQEWGRSLGSPRTLADVARFQLFNQGALQQRGGARSSRKTDARFHDFSGSLEYRRRRMRLAAQLKAENPHWTARECNDEASNLLQRDRFA